MSNEKVKGSELPTATPTSEDFITGTKVNENGSYTASKFPFSDFTGTGFANYAEVSISSAEILTLGDSPISLLPTLGAQEYYDAKLIFEYTDVGVDYVLADKLVLRINGTSNCLIPASFITSGGNKLVSITDPYIFLPNEADGTVERVPVQPGSGMDFQTLEGNNPTTGNGTILVKIWYTVRTFGTEL